MKKFIFILYADELNKYTEITKITPEILNGLIEKILVHQANNFKHNKKSKVNNAFTLDF